MSCPPGLRRAALAAAMLVLVGTLSGCVERRYTIRSNVPALVVVNGEELGTTPVSRSFWYYGDREITLMAPGYETRHEIVEINAPWWDNLATEFFTENLVPYTFRDEREFTFELKPPPPVAPEDVRGRAEALRAQATQPPPPRRGGILGWLGF